MLSFLPTSDKLALKASFLRFAVEIYKNNAGSRVLYTDAQFRWLREDMLHDLREEIQIACSSKKGCQRGLCIEHLSMIDRCAF